MTTLLHADYQRYQQPILHIRELVFIEEQHVPPELEVDEQDPLSQHVLLLERGMPVATGRLTPDGHIGRVAVLKDFRKRGFGQQVIQGLEEIAHQRGISRVVLGAQYQAINFYLKLGYQTVGDVFMDAGIKHQMMEKMLNQE